MFRDISLERMNPLDYLRLTRPPNGLLMVTAVMVGHYVQSTRLPGPLEALLASATAYCLSSSSMVLNDIVDREIDSVSNPERPIASGRVSVRSAWFFAVILGALGLASAAALGPPLLFVAVIFYTLATVYNTYLKRRGLAGNIAVSATIAAPYIFGAVLADGRVGGLVSIFALMSFLAGLGREVVKGIPDVEGDALKGVKTLAVTRGPRVAARLGVFFVMLAIVLSPIPFLLNQVGLPYLVLVAVADAGFVYSSAKLLRDLPSSRRVKREYLLWMGIALAAFMLGAV